MSFFVVLGRFMRTRKLADRVLEALRSQRFYILPEEDQMRLEDWFVNLK